jgi:hypothetical protein
MKSPRLRKVSAALLSRLNRLLSALLPMALLAVGAAFGQTTTATLSGVVQDSSGSVLPGVENQPEEDRHGGHARDRD